MQTAYIYFSLAGFVYMFILGFLVSEISTNYTFCKKNNINYNTDNKYDCHQIKKLNAINIK